MRQIKFRVWNAKDHWYFTPDIAPNLKSDGALDCRLGFFDELMVQQSTGLLDKNGKEIYEGDILIYEYTQADMSSFSALESGYETCAIEEVVFENGAFRFKGDKYSTVFDDCGSMEVIGNIFENSELINK